MDIITAKQIVKENTRNLLDTEMVMFWDEEKPGNNLVCIDLKKCAPETDEDWIKLATKLEKQPNESKI